MPRADLPDVKLVCFDLGRVLVRICDGWQHACAVAGLAMPATELPPATAAALHDLVCQLEVGAITSDTFYHDAGAAFGVPPAHVRAMSDAYVLGAYPGAAELLDDLKAAGATTACLSNTNENHWRLISDPGSSSYFPLDRLTHRFASHLVRLRKPDDAIYAHVERALEIPGDQIAFFDDISENVEAAKRRGWHAHRVESVDDPMPEIRAHLRAHGVLR
jgi:putative hydrolase of the HAD superfamily